MTAKPGEASPPCDASSFTFDPSRARLKASALAAAVFTVRMMSTLRLPFPTELASSTSDAPNA